MPKKKRSRLVKPKIKINWKKFQNDPEAYEFLRGMLKMVKKYTGMGIAEMVSAYKRDAIARDHIALAASNVFLAVHAGKAMGDHLKAEGMRKAERGHNFVKIKEEAAAEGDKITDSLAAQQAEKMSKRSRLRESAALERREILLNVMHRVNKLLDALDSAGKTLTAEWGKTNA